jgi:hypothetical protein
MFNFNIKPLLIVFLFCNYISGLSQTNELGSWNILNIKYIVNDKWSLFSEGQIRSLKFYNHFHYFEYKVGINYKIEKNTAFTIGSGNYQTYKEGGNFVLPKNNNEFRIWPQLNLFQSIGKIKIEQRYRYELRFTSNGYRNRFRYRVGLLHSFGKKINDYKPFQVSVSNELFFTNNEPYFERNRLILALSYKPSKTSTIQIGYIHQFDYKINDETGRDFFQIGYFFELFKNKSVGSDNIIDLKDN